MERRSLFSLVTFSLTGGALLATSSVDPPVYTSELTFEGESIELSNSDPSVHFMVTVTRQKNEDDFSLAALEVRSSATHSDTSPQEQENNTPWITLNVEQLQEGDEASVGGSAGSGGDAAPLIENEIFLESARASREFSFANSTIRFRVSFERAKVADEDLASTIDWHITLAETHTREQDDGEEPNWDVEVTPYLEEQP